MFRFGTWLFVSILCFAAASAMAQGRKHPPILKSPTLPTRRGRSTSSRPLTR